LHIATREFETAVYSDHDKFTAGTIASHRRHP
jgi:hypothetical protein